MAKLRSAQSVADLTDGIVMARVEIAAAPDRVFRALTTDELTKWWGADGQYRTTNFAIDPRPGGKWRSMSASPRSMRASSLARRLRKCRLKLPLCM